ncbi:putative secreted protein [Granulibacter bethesdensis]|uniref:Secreted protein n=1 Tax=Granulibacter bethesdensis TaxID=364410 RepID=A0AAC9K9T6_9PROT|nr:Spy/CpxP family protein refolding chaperone [Granulibacter bethesdensis]APH54656.1 putative secreted protein [Granulibacter bethesdensis]APH62242.1 putative secreted protein [Granulibacter bethesdensis]
MDLLMTRRSRAAWGFLGMLSASPALAAQDSHARDETPPSLASQPATPQAPSSVTHASSRVERQIQRLYKALAITPAQQQPWENFTRVLRSNAAATDQAYAEAARPEAGANALTRFQAYRQVQTVQADNLRRLEPVFTALYQALSPAQQKTADRLFEQRTKAAMRSFPAHQ